MSHRNSGRTPAQPQTSTLEAARAHARSQVGSSGATGPAIPATAAVDLPAGVDPADVLWDEVVPVGGYTTLRLPRGSHVLLADLGGDACVQLVAHVLDRPWERLNVADTIKVQWQAYLGTGSLLLSDMGRVLLTLVRDTSERHDCLCGGSNRASNGLRYGDGWLGGPAPSARDLLVVGGAKHGLSRADVATPVNLFKSVRVDPDGGLALDGGIVPDTLVELRAELDVLVLLAVTPHPLDDRSGYEGSPVRCTAWRVEPAGDDDVARSSTPERQRAFLNTDELVRGGG